MLRTFRVGLAMVLGMGSLAITTLAVPQIALAGTCSVTFLVGPYVSDDNHINYVQSSVQVNCPIVGRGGDYVQLQIIKTSTGTVVANRQSAQCSFSCDYHHINAVATSAACSSSTSTSYYARVRWFVDDKFGWEPWSNGTSRSLACHL